MMKVFDFLASRDPDLYREMGLDVLGYDVEAEKEMGPSWIEKIRN